MKNHLKYINLFCLLLISILTSSSISFAGELKVSQVGGKDLFQFATLYKIDADVPVPRTWAEVQSQKTLAKSMDDFVAGSGRFFIGITLTNDTAVVQELAGVAGGGLVDANRLLLFDKSGALTVRQNIGNQAFRKQLEMPVFARLSFSIPPKESVLVYIDVQSRYLEAYPTFDFFDRTAFEVKRFWIFTFLMASLGVSLALAAVYFLMSSVLGRFAFFWYACLLVLNSVRVLTMQGFAVYFFGIDDVGMLTMQMVNLTSIILLLFTFSFLNLSAVSPKAHKLLIGLCVGLCCVGVTVLFIPDGLGYGMIMVGLMTAVTSMLIVAYLRYRAGFRPAIFLLLSKTMLAITFVVLVVLKLRGINIFSDSSVVVFGMEALSAVIMSLGMIDLLRTLQTERDEATTLAVTDTLTKVGNRLAFERTVSSLNKANRPFSVAMIDLDGMKKINDTQGHELGDELLVSFCKNAADIFGRQFLYFRTGGDEFVFILQTNDRQDMELILQNNRAVLAERMYQSGFLEFGMSFGTAHLSETKTVSQCLGLADERMYSDKADRKKHQNRTRRKEKSAHDSDRA